MEKLTKPQLQAIKKLWKSDPDSSLHYKDFRKRFCIYNSIYVTGTWCGMFVGIEKDGYTHT